MSQNAPVADTDSEEREAETADPVASETATTPETDAGPGASESGFALRFGSGFAAGMLVGGVVGVALNSLPLAMFGGFIFGSIVGIVLAARA